MREFIPVLKRSALFQGVSEDEIEVILQCFGAREQRYKKGEYVFRIGEEISSIALLLEGDLHIQREDYWGNLSILQKIRPGEIVGEAYAVPGSGPMVNHVIATTSSRVLFLDTRHLVITCSRSCRFHHQMVQNLLAVLADKNRMLARKLGHMSKRSTREKLLSYLSEQSMSAGSPSFTVPFNRQQLADYLSVDRSAMSSELCKLRDQGIVEFDRNSFKLLSQK